VLHVVGSQRRQVETVKGSQRQSKMTLPGHPAAWCCAARAPSPLESQVQSPEIQMVDICVTYVTYAGGVFEIVCAACECQLMNAGRQCELLKAVKHAAVLCN
jgi:hypothetical protein